ncbi:DsbA family oxidoreductase, partial [Escherichia coli]|nr:DsbA family oxidoreductase [Escherichia coli]
RLPLNLPAIARTPNTLNAHRLIHWAGIEGRQTPVVSFLFQAYFQDGQDIGDTEVLVQVAERAEMDGAAIRRLLAGDADAQLTRDRDAHARQRGVTGVPTFVVANAHVVVGAQPPELWDRVIDELTAPRPDDAPLQ